MNSEFEAVRQYLNNDDHLCRARLSRLEEGSGRGQRVVDVTNGSGLAFTITPDRGMNIVECSFAGNPVAFWAPGGHRGVSGNWSRDWSAGLFTTCGLQNAGNPSGGHGLHGSISSESAEQLSIRCRGGEAEISGLLREAAIFSANLTLDRKIRTAYGKNVIDVEDTITNCGENTTFTEILYHCNLGYPLVSPDLELVCAEHEIIPRDNAAGEDLANWNVYPEPLENFHEYCYRHLIPATNGTFANMALVNRKIGIKLTVEYDTVGLPHLVQWKKPSRNNYVLGIEPGNVSLAGCEFDSKNNFGKFLAPGEQSHYHFRLIFEKI